AGVVAVRDAAGDLRAFESESGRARWRHDGDAGEARSAAAGHGGRFFLTDGPDVLALDARSGAIAWRVGVATAAARVTAPAAGGQTVYVATSEGDVVALDAASGRERWRHDTDAPIVVAPAVGEGLVVVVTADGRLIALH
ncbi:MAG TPA: PQQ-binding-like beta-propeller repeat protein, partial [Nitriliruptorales bacterium]|nr:PQQ-binding-like beta-propeller repeat protein [Nitriliruptorales bacterium]